MKYHITKSELEILQVLWNADSSLSRSGILNHAENKTWKDNSIHILLNGMLKKGLIKEAGFTRSGKVWGRLYAPVLTLKEYYADQLDNMPLSSSVEMLSYILSREDIDAGDLEKLQNLLLTYQGKRKEKSEMNP